MRVWNRELKETCLFPPRLDTAASHSDVSQKFPCLHFPTGLRKSKWKERNGRCREGGRGHMTEEMPK